MIEEEIDRENLVGMRAQNLSLRNEQELTMAEKERGMIKDQLDLTEELERIEHLLRGHTLKYNEQGDKEWIERVEFSGS